MLAADAFGPSRVAASVPRPSRPAAEKAYLTTSRLETDRWPPRPLGVGESSTGNGNKISRGPNRRDRQGRGNNDPKTVLVTGGTGWIGSLCIIELLRRGYTVRTTARSLDKEPVVRAQISTIIDPGERLSFFVADLTNDAGWDVAVAVCEYALHRLLVNCLLFLRELAGRAHNEIDLIVERFPLYECRGHPRWAPRPGSGCSGHLSSLRAATPVESRWSRGVPVVTAMYSRAVSSNSPGKRACLSPPSSESEHPPAAVAHEVDLEAGHRPPV
ncbi:MAG: dependent epimerase/dehydratase family protein [Mycobacterium sp.]|nr:dependent epimerase/dehydratase family protein [Mycobacterium sp.]